MATANLNKLASALCGDNTKIRLRSVDGLIQIRPTNRGTAVGLPKGELLIDLRSKKQAVPALRFTLPKELELQVSTCYRAVEAKHGWISLVAMSAEQRAEAQITNGAGPKTPHVSITDK